MKKNKLFNTLRADALTLGLNNDVCQNTKIEKLYDEQHYLEFYDVLYRKIQQLETKRMRKAYITKMKMIFCEHELEDDKGLLRLRDLFTYIFTMILAMFISKVEFISDKFGELTGDLTVVVLFLALPISIWYICLLQKKSSDEKRRSMFYSLLLSDLETVFNNS